MFKKVIGPDRQRRLVLQGTVLSAAAIAVPGIANANCAAGNHELAKASGVADGTSALNSDDVTIELVETKVSVKGGSLARVTITNASDRSIKLSHLSPGAVSTQKGVYQINANLRNNPIAVRPNGTYQFWLTPDDGTQALLSRKPKPTAADTSTVLEVSVITETPAGTWHGIQRVQAII